MPPKRQLGAAMKHLYGRIKLSKFIILFKGLVFALMALTFFLIGLKIISSCGIYSRLLWIPFLGIILCVTFGTVVMSGSGRHGSISI